MREFPSNSQLNNSTGPASWRRPVRSRLSSGWPRTAQGLDPEQKIDFLLGSAGLARLGSAWLGSAGLAWPGLAWLGLVWPGLLGLAWLVLLGLACFVYQFGSCIMFLLII